MVDECLIYRTNLEYLHVCIQDLEQAGIELPLGKYDDLYNIIEEVRDYFFDLAEGKG